MAADTRDRILDMALEMFSRNGYKGTNLRDLAAALGLSKSALYRHFESKDAIFDALIEQLEAYYAERFGSVEHIPPVPSFVEEFKALTLSMIDFTVHDAKIRRIRQFFASEQFRDERVAELATKHFLDTQVNIFTPVFEGMMTNGLIKKADAGMLAFAFTTPVTAMIHLCDRQPDRENEAMEKINEYINMFIETYRTHKD